MIARCLSVVFVLQTLLWVNVARSSDDKGENPHFSPIANGWSRTKINTTIYRTEALATWGDTQYVAFYDPDRFVTLARRKLGTDEWEVKKTQYKGNVNDTHNVICIAFDGKGVLHMSWDHHCGKLRYCRSVEAGSMELTDKLEMTGYKEGCVTYPEFFNLPDGDLLFMYRDGSSGNGNMMLKRYDVETGKWSLVQNSFINGNGERNAYTNQIGIGKDGTWHIFWCWRETPDAMTNHDICYAKSDDEGKTWKKSTGEKYELPITSENAEVVVSIPQKMELINTSSTAVDSKGNAITCQYWRPEDDKVTPQYHLVFHDGKGWQVRQITHRKTPFSLRDIGRKPIQISRPKVLVDKHDRVYVIFRDMERGDGVSVAMAEAPKYDEWVIKDITDIPLGPWEPCYDVGLWRSKGVIHLFHQVVAWQDKEKDPTMVSVLEWTPE